MLNCSSKPATQVRRPAHKLFDFEVFASCLANRRRCLQGLVDAHVHILFGGCTLQQIDLRYVTSKTGFVLEVQKAAGETSVLDSKVSFKIAITDEPQKISHESPVLHGQSAMPMLCTFTQAKGTLLHTVWCMLHLTYNSSQAALCMENACSYFLHMSQVGAPPHKQVCQQ